MIIYFTEEDLVSFGRYILSDRRTKSFKENPNFDIETLDERLKDVHDADIANWAYLVSTNKQIDAEVNNENRTQN